MGEARERASMPLTSEQVNEWVCKFLVATSGGGGATPATDWKTLQDLFSKRSSVEMPGEPKYKKFEDWQKKGTVYYNSFKGAKRTIPEGAAPIIMPPSGKKDEYEVIVPEHTLFEWNSGSQLTLDPLK